MKYTFLILLLTVTFIAIRCDKTNPDYAQCLQDIELAAKMGSGEPVTIDLNATEGLEGEIAQTVRDATQKASKPKTFLEKVKSFFW